MLNQNVGDLLHTIERTELSHVRAKLLQLLIIPSTPLTPLFLASLPLFKSLGSSSVAGLLLGPSCTWQADDFHLRLAISWRVRCGIPAATLESSKGKRCS